MRLEDRRLEGDASVGPHLSAQFARHHQAQEMFYSVVCSTEDDGVNRVGTLNLTEKKELWLAKLGSWTEALEVYEEKLDRNPSDFDAILGCMRCLSAGGEWRRVLELAEANWPTLSGTLALGQESLQDTGLSLGTVYIAPRHQKKALRICAQAAWRLGRWDDLEKYSSELVHGQTSSQPAAATMPTAAATGRDGFVPRVDFDGAFFSAVLHVHRKEWAMASEAIDAARKAMDSRFTALMAESYNRAYPSIVTAQTLAEMEEIIEYRKIEEGSKASAHRHPANCPNKDEARERLLSVWRERLAGCRVDAEVHSSILAVRSLVLGPTDEVQATLTLSELSRQAQRFKLAERVLLDPLAALGADLDGPHFGFGLAESLGLRMELEEAMATTPLPHIIDGLVTNRSGAFLPNYGQMHENWSKQLVQEAGGLER
jgi:tetratricopeptide (TPR) repeat protein